VPEPSDWTILPIRRDHDRDSFDCGNSDLNQFLQKYARQSDDLAIARTFVAVKAKGPRVHGYYSMRTGQVHFDRFPPEQIKRLPKYPIPVVHLARLAVDNAAKGVRLGETLLLDALEKSLKVSRDAAAYAVEVVAIDDSAKGFYLKYGFKELLDDRLHLYLPMRTIEALFADRG
jgi:predicted GNAT family N-acyltransferase